MAVPESGCSVIKNARTIIAVHIAVLALFLFAMHAAFADMPILEEDMVVGTCSDSAALSLPTKVFLAFGLGALMNLAVPVP